MPVFSASLVLLDIEGTTSSIDFVHEVMFPYARQHLAGFLETQAEHPELPACLQQLGKDLGKPAGWSEQPLPRLFPEVIAGVLALMDGDVKATGLKQLQGMIWKQGFESGQLVSHLYEDVLPALQHWQSLGLRLAVYSSGSIAAQRLFFGHTRSGDLLPLFCAHFDTTTGPKKEAASYRAIASDLGLPPEAIVFISDVPEELQAASEAGLQTVLSVRPGNAAVAPGHGFAEITAFDQLQIQPLA